MQAYTHAHTKADAFAFFGWVWLQAVLRGDFEEDDTIVVEAVSSAAEVRGRQRGDGNYRSGLQLRKGPKVGGEAIKTSKTRRERVNASKKRKQAKERELGGRVNKSRAARNVGKAREHNKRAQKEVGGKTTAASCSCQGTWVEKQ